MALSKISTIPTISPDQQLTLKQEKWLKLYLETNNATEAAMRVYDCKDRDSAANIGWENVRKLDYHVLMEAQGLTDQYLNDKLNEGLDSMKQIGARKIVQGARVGHEIRVDSTTDTDDFIDVPDMPTRHKYLETAFKLKGRLIARTDMTTNGKDIEPMQILFVEDKQSQGQGKDE